MQRDVRIDRPDPQPRDDIQPVLRILEHRIAPAQKAGERLALHIRAGRHDLARRVAHIAELGIDQVPENAVAALARVADQHGREVEIVEYLVEVGIDIDDRKPAVDHLPR
ncbi:hypothetical protein D3C72_1905990 [compost metagenome]